MIIDNPTLPYPSSPLRVAAYRDLEEGSTSQMPHQASEDSTDELADMTAVEAVPSPSQEPDKPAALPFKKRLTVALVGLLGTMIIRMLALTLRYRIHFANRITSGRSVPQTLETLRGPDKKPLIFALWHGSCLPIVCGWRGRGVCVVTSLSTDGQILDRILHGLGFTTARGSSSRGGTRALLDLTHIVRSGTDAAITVDGPRGPAQQAKPGIILLAKMTGRPIIPIASCSKRFWRFQSWDRFRLPLPFSKTAIAGGDPIYIPADATHEEMEAHRLALEEAIRKLQSDLDAHVGPKIWKRADTAKTLKREAKLQAMQTK